MYKVMAVLLWHCDQPSHQYDVLVWTPELEFGRLKKSKHCRAEFKQLPTEEETSNRLFGKHDDKAASGARMQVTPEHLLTPTDLAGSTVESA